MGWFAAVGLIALVLFWLWRLAEFRGRRLEWLGAALLIGLAGYAWQGSPVLEGQPTENRRERPPEGSTDINEEFLDNRDATSERWIQFAEALNRVGNHMNAAHAIQNGIDNDPDNPDLWVALGNALLLHGEGQMNPAAQLAFERAAQIAPEHPGPPFFLGLALAQAGRLNDAEATWRTLLERTPEDAPYRADLESRLASIARAQGRPVDVPVAPAPEDETGA
ncbi:tetratricopeptide repeat protein [Parasphingopyxis algicola]|uniref:tetratricopeptide repeat protein n=1 Tax=Parasphingopyxis algicola TaxID=2026624 RepID=UPI0015A027D0|nr:tetratricopeptide repeat protein [Parasphingopyxis algicola]QLC24079.1 tetratricopeptide repeat protein [Parasphingopyxis algicola]